MTPFFQLKRHPGDLYPWYSSKKSGYQKAAKVKAIHSAKDNYMEMNFKALEEKAEEHCEQFKEDGMEISEQHFCLLTAW